MDCDSCGRYRPSSEIAALRTAHGQLVMACARCRRLTVGRRETEPPARMPAEVPTVAPGTAASVR